MELFSYYIPTRPHGVNPKR